MHNLKALNIKASDVTSGLMIFSVCFLFATLPFGYTGALRIAIYILLGAFVIDYIVSGVYKQWQWNRNKLYFTLPILFFLLQFIFLPFETNTDYFHQICEDRLSFLAIGVIGIMGLNKRLKLEYVAWTCVIVAVACCIYLYSSITLKPETSSLREHLAWYRIQNISSHMLFNMYLNISIVFAYFLMKSYRHKGVRIALAISALLMMATVAISEGRMGFVSCCIVIAIMAIYELWHWRRWSVAFVAIPIIAFAFTASLNSRFNADQLGDNPRLQIWGYALEDIKEHPMGMGASTAGYTVLKELETAIDAGEFTDNFVGMAVKERSIYGAHSHCQYMQTMLEYGPIGVLVLLAILLTPIFICQGRVRVITVAFCFLFAAQLCTDILVSGIIPIGFLLILCLLVTRDVAPDNSCVD